MGSLRREIPMDISQDCSKCGFPVDEAAQVVLGDQLLHPGCRGGRGAAQRGRRRRRTSCDEVEDRTGFIRGGRHDRRISNELTPKLAGPGSQMSAPAPSMESADKGVGALYIVMDAIKRRKAEEKEKAERQREEEEFHNKMNRGRQILPPL